MMPSTSNIRNTLGPSWIPAPISFSSLACSRTCTGKPARARLSAAERPPMPAPTIRKGRSRALMSVIQASAEKVAERLEEALQVIHRNHMAGIRYDPHRHGGGELPDLVERLGGERPFARRDEQRPRLDPREVGVDIVGLKAAVCLRDSGLVAGMQPFRPHPDVLVLPGRCEGTQLVQRSRASRKPDGGEIPFQRAWVWRPPRTAQRWIDNNELPDPRIIARRADGDPAAHRMPHQEVRSKAKRLREFRNVTGVRVQRIVEIRAGGRQSPPADIEDISVEAAPESLPDEAPRRSRAGDPGHDDERRPCTGTAVAQVMLPDPVRKNVTAVAERARMFHLDRGVPDDGSKKYRLRMI